MNTINQQEKKDAPEKHPFSVKQPGEYNGNEEPVEEKSDQIYAPSNNKEIPDIDMPSPAPRKIEKKIPGLRKES
jgi:hypothetical protein